MAESLCADVRAVDLFAGPGGWDEGLSGTEIKPLGIEWDAAACATREAAGHRTLQADVAALEPLNFPCELLIASPPCQAFSVAGDGKGREDVELISACARNFMVGVDVRHVMRPKLQDERSLLVVEPLRWALALEPTYIALEQVPPVLGLWKLYAKMLEDRGWRAWAGLLNAADYGVPQTRERAFLLASRRGGVHPPHPTHCKGGAMTLQGDLQPWISMSDALGWGMTARPYPALACSSDTGGPDKEKVGGSGAREGLYREQSEGRWILRTGTTTQRGNGQLDSYERPDDEPSPVVREQTRSWCRERPATTIAGDARVFPPGGHKANDGRDNSRMVGRSENAIRIELSEALILQGFRPDYPVKGNKSEQFRQVGNAVPPPVSRSVIEALLEGRSVRGRSVNHGTAIAPGSTLFDALRPGVAWRNKHNGDETTITSFSSRVERIPAAAGGFVDDSQLVVHHTANVPPGFTTGWGDDARNFVEHWEPRGA